MENVMLDLETYATRTDAVILSIGACFFDKEEVGHGFYAVLDRDEQITKGRYVDPRTVGWWAVQSDAARKLFAEPQFGVVYILDAFSLWVATNTQYPDDVKMWGNGSDFDNAILGNLYDQYDLTKPWRHSNNRCFRTLKNLCEPFGSHDLPEREGTHHHALHDAEYQAAMAGRYLKGKLK
jgi:3' exoribonuclease, RNase T-like